MNPVYCCGLSFPGVQSWRWPGKKPLFIMQRGPDHAKSKITRKKKPFKRVGSFTCMAITWFYMHWGAENRLFNMQDQTMGTNLGKVFFRTQRQVVCGSCFNAHLQLSLTQRRWSFPLQTVVLRVEGVEHPALPRWDLPAHPSGTHFCSSSANMPILFPGFHVL